MLYDSITVQQGPTLTRYRSAAANIIIDIGGGVAGAPKNLSRRRLRLFLISGGVHISEWWGGSFWNLPNPRIGYILAHG